MLKFLRKYSQWILVIGGTLLMIAFLLPTTLSEIGQRPLFTTVMWIDGDRVGAAEFDLAAREHAAMSRLTFETLPMVGNVENADHWLLLVREAQKGGYIAGKGEGSEFLPDLVRQMLFASGRAYTTPPDQLESLTKSMVSIMEQGMSSMQTEFGLTQDQLYLALAKLHGIIRMQVAYQRAPRFSDRRLAAGMKRTQDRTDIEYIFVPPDQVMSDIPEPSEEQIAAHFAKYSDAEAGSGELGLGYRLPDRVKLEWLTLDRAAIAASVRPDPVEVHKRFLLANPSGEPSGGQTLEQAKAPFETEVRNEVVDRVMKAADQAVRGEFERALRRTQPEGVYRKLPADWAQIRPDLDKLREAVVLRVKEQTGADIPAPTVYRRGEWTTLANVASIEGIGRSFLQRGSQREPFSTVLFRVRELAGDNDTALQVGVPGDALTDFAGNRFYMVVTEARKSSAPDSVDDVRADVVKDLKRLAAFEKLTSQIDAYRQRAIEEGLQPLSDDEDSAIQPPKRATVVASGIFPADPNIADEAFRNRLLEIGSGLDPGVNIPELPPENRTVVAPMPKAFGLAIARVVGISPVTEDVWRRSQASTVANLVREELRIESPADNPFSYQRLRERLKVIYKNPQLNEPKPQPDA